MASCEHVVLVVFFFFFILFITLWRSLEECLILRLWIKGGKGRMRGLVKDLVEVVYWSLIKGRECAFLVGVIWIATK